MLDGYIVVELTLFLVGAYTVSLFISLTVYEYIFCLWFERVVAE